MVNQFYTLKNEINMEEDNLERLIKEKRLFFKERMNPDNILDIFDIRAVGSILHDFYCSVEEIIKTIIKTIDGELPKAEDWHRKILLLSTREINGVRPSIFSCDTVDMLEEYLRFRYLFRHAYGFQLKWDKMSHLITEIEVVWEKVKEDIVKFNSFIDSVDV